MNTELRILSSRSPGREQSMAMARHAALATNLDNLSLMLGPTLVGEESHHQIVLSPPQSSHSAH